MEGRILKATAFCAKNGNAFASFTIKTDGDNPETHQYSVNPDNISLGFEGDVVMVDAITNAGAKGLEMLLKATVGLKCELETDDEDNVEYFSAIVPSERVAFVVNAIDKFIARG